MGICNQVPLVQQVDFKHQTFRELGMRQNISGTTLNHPRITQEIKLTCAFRADFLNGWQYLVLTIHGGRRTCRRYFMTRRKSWVLKCFSNFPLHTKSRPKNKWLPGKNSIIGLQKYPWHTHPNTNNGYPKWWLGNGDSFEINMAIFGIYSSNFWGVRIPVLNGWIQVKVWAMAPWVIQILGQRWVGLGSSRVTR